MGWVEGRVLGDGFLPGFPHLPLCCAPGQGKRFHGTGGSESPQPCAQDRTTQPPVSENTCQAHSTATRGSLETGGQTPRMLASISGQHESSGVFRH